jgi:SAM-dependent methyltransferase
LIEPAAGAILGRGFDVISRQPEGADMRPTDRVFAGSIPALYDRYLGPLIFEPYAADLAKRLEDLTAGRLLEIAAGTGVVTRALARLPDAVAIVATDLNPPMLAFAAARMEPRRPITWRQADALALPFAESEFDVAVCQFGVMFFPDKRTAFREALRVLKPGGRFLFNVWDRIEVNEFAQVVSEAVAALFPENPPRFMARTPHGYHDTGMIRDELKAVGFSSIAIETVERRSKAPSARDPAIGFCQGTPLRNEIDARDPRRLAEVTEAATRAIAERFGEGPVEGKMQAHVVTAVR